MAQGQNQNLEGGAELEYLAQKDPFLGKILRRVISAINTTAKNANVAAIGLFPTPPQVDTVNVAGTFSSDTNTITTTSEHLHWTMEHNQQVHKGVQYFSEIDTDPNFTQPHVIPHNSSRTGLKNLPALDDNGAQNVYYLRSYAQYHGSDPSEPTVVGGKSNPTKIVLTGTSKMSLLPSKGSGTAASSGQQGGKGLGDVLTRPAPAPKRSIIQH